MVWNLTIVDENLTAIFSFLIFWYIRFLTFGLQGRNFFEYYGLADIPRGVDEMEKVRSKMPLKTDGFYNIVRHPMYLLQIMTFLLSPVMSLDRLLMAMCSIVYVMASIPFEESHLIEEFGPRYKDYQETTPALFPFMKFLKRGKVSPKAK